MRLDRGLNKRFAPVFIYVEHPTFYWYVQIIFLFLQRTRKRVIQMGVIEIR